MSSIRDQFEIVVKKFAGVVRDQDIKKLIFKDTEGKEHRFTGYEDKTIPSVIDSLISCEWEKAEDAASSIISQSGEPRGPEPKTEAPTKSFASKITSEQEVKVEEEEE